MPAVRYPKEVTAQQDILEKGALGIPLRPSYNSAKNIRANVRDSLKLLVPFLVRFNVIRADIGMRDQALRKKTATKAKEIRNNVTVVISGRNTNSVFNGQSCFVWLALVIFSMVVMTS